MSLPALPDESNVIVVIVRWRVTKGLLICLALAMSLFYMRTYERLHDPVEGWTKMISFGGLFAARTLPRVQHIVHHVTPPDNAGADGQFYAQLAIDPSLRDPAFDQALDNPGYRARRIGLSATAFVLGWGKPRRILEAYALSNLLFWFLLMGALFRLFRPRTGRDLLCLCGALLGYGVVASMELSATDLPATALIFAALLMGASSWGRYATLAAAALTRETSVLAAFSFLDPRRLWREWRERREWKRPAGLLALALVPLVLWTAYVLHRFGRAEEVAGARNFSLPFQAMFQCFAHAVDVCREQGLSAEAQEAAPLGWLWADGPMRHPLTIVGLFFQVAYLGVRRDPASAVWRTGIAYAVLCTVLGTAVWEEVLNIVRAMLPMTVCFYLLLARERGWWFWVFFVLGGMALPYSVHEFWVVQ